MWGGPPHFFVPPQLRLDVSDTLERLVVEELDRVGFDLVELRNGGTRSRPVIEVRIDRRDGSAVTVDDCAVASRVIEARLDAGSGIAERYVLQVSSPGDRPLRTPGEWRRFVGRWASVLAPESGGRFEGKILAVEGEEGAEAAVLDLGRNKVQRVPLASVKEARLAFRI